MPDPRYTIFLPVHNGGEYVKLCVASILSQTYRDFELAVLENGSTDGTAQWLSTLDDPRVKVYSSSTLLPREDNWARPLTTPKREFMTFIGHDDLLEPEYLQAIHDLIESNPEAGLYQVHFRFIDEAGHEIGRCPALPPRETATEWLRAYFQNQRPSYSGYMMSSADHDRLGGFPSFEGCFYADDALWLELTALSYKAAAPQTGFSLRSHDTRYTGNAPALSYVTSVRDFIIYLTQLQTRRPELAPVITEYGEEFFLASNRHRYRIALKQASLAGERLDPAFKATVLEALEHLNPEIVERFSDRKVRLHEWINRVPAARSIFRLYQRGFGGQTRRPLKRLRSIMRQRRIPVENHQGQG